MDNYNAFSYVDEKREENAEVERIMDSDKFGKMFNHVTHRERFHEKAEMLDECFCGIREALEKCPGKEDGYYIAAARFALYELLGLENQNKPGAKERSKFRSHISIYGQSGEFENDSIGIIDRLESESDISFDDYIVAKEIVSEVIYAMDVLSPKNREIITQKFHEEISSVKIGSEYGISENAVNTRTNHNVRKLINEILPDGRTQSVSYEVLREAGIQLYEYLEEMRTPKASQTVMKEK